MVSTNSYSGRIYDHARYPIRTIKQGQTRSCVLAGPTCDSIDVIEENIELPELEIGDLVIGEVMGAYHGRNGHRVQFPAHKQGCGAE